MAKHRAKPLRKLEQRSFLRHHVPGRIDAITFHLSRSPRHYGDLAVAAIFGRALCSFMGIRVDRQGKLAKDRGYFEHSGKDSWEVKIRDLPRGKFLRIGDLSDQERSILESGLCEANLSFAHLTFWTNRKTQTSGGRATKIAKQTQAAIIERFANLSIRLCQERLKMVTVI
jgi:hypothetical protein